MTVTSMNINMMMVMIVTLTVIVKSVSVLKLTTVFMLCFKLKKESLQCKHTSHIWNVLVFTCSNWDNLQQSYSQNGFQQL